MAEKASVWDLFNSTDKLNEEDDSRQGYNKKAKGSSNKNDIIWLKSLVNPTAEKFFIKLHVTEVISVSNQQIICKIKMKETQFPDYSSIIGFFSVWWWRDSLDKLDFITIQDLMSSFPFLERIRRNDQLIQIKSVESLDFYLLVNDPKIIPNETDPNIGLLTSKRVLVIDWREDD